MAKTSRVKFIHSMTFKKRVVFDSVLALTLCLLVRMGWLACRDKTISCHAVFLGGMLGGLSLLALFISLKLELARRIRAEAELRDHQDRLTELVNERTQELRREREALHSSQTLLQTVVDGIPSPIFMKDREGRLEVANPATLHAMGRTAGEVIGKTDGEVYGDPEIGRAIMKTDRRIMESGISEIVEETVQTPEGIRFFLSTKTPRRDANQQVIGLIGVATDITERKKVDEALRESEARYRSLFEGSLDCIFTVDETGQLLTANPSAERVSGYTAEELTAKKFTELCAPDQLAATQAAFLEGLAGSAREMETALIRKDGRRVELFISATPMIIANEARGLFCVALDITQRKQAEVERQKFISLVDQSSEFVGICDMELRPIYSNEAALRLVGLESLEQACSTPVADFFFPEDQAFIVGEFFPRVLQEGRAEIEIRFRHFQTGAAIWMIYNVFYIRDAAGKPTGFATVSRNITERKLAEERLRLLSTALESAANGIVITNAQGTIEWVNPAFTKLTGYSYDEVIGQNLRVIKSGEHPPEFYRELWATILRGKPWHGEMINRRKDGTLYTEEQTITPVRTGGGAITHFVAVKEDITERKRVEEGIRILNEELESRVIERTAELQTAVDALEAEIVNRRRLEREVLKISEHEQSRIGRDLHDGACQNLACIAVLAEVAARDLDREKSQTAVKAREISEIARQSMDEVRRLAAGLFPVKIEQHGLEWALRELAAETSARRRVDCNFLMHQPVAFSDLNAAVQLYRIAQEAVSNAVRHGNARSIAIELVVSEGTASLIIRDDGTGMPSQKKKGGLGLHTMEYRARMLGGSLDVITETGRGTTIICSFPEKEFIHAKENSNS